MFQKIFLSILTWRAQVAAREERPPPPPFPLYRHFEKFAIRPDQEVIVVI